MADAAEDRTEAPSEKRLQSARESGQVPLSREATPASVLAATALVLATMLPGATRGLASTLATFLSNADRFDPGLAIVAAARAAIPVVAPFALAAALAAALAVLGQTGFLIRLAALQPGLDRLSVPRNLRRLLGPANALELGRSLLKVGLAGAAVCGVANGLRPWLGQAVMWDPAALPEHMATLAMRLLLAVLAVQGILAGLDALRRGSRTCGRCA